MTFVGLIKVSAVAWVLENDQDKYVMHLIHHRNGYAFSEARVNDKDFS